MTKTIEYQVVGELLMDCITCEQRIGRVLRQLTGVEATQASSKNQRIVVTIQSEEVSLEQVQARLEQMGYQVLFQGGDR